jgi:hypothetical protein
MPASRRAIIDHPRMSFQPFVARASSSHRPLRPGGREAGRDTGVTIAWPRCAFS